MPTLQEIERVLKKNHDNWLSYLQGANYHKHSATLYRAINDTYTSVYGRTSGEEGVTKITTFDCVCVGDSFFASDNSSSGSFTEGWLFTDSKDIRVADLVDLIREDKTTRRYKVISFERLGTSVSVFGKWKLSAVGD